MKKEIIDELRDKIESLEDIISDLLLNLRII